MEYHQKSARLPRIAEEKEKWQRAIVILEHCPLQSIQTERGFELLSERHRAYHARHQQDPAEWRPDVVHQCLLHLQDSPLNRAGKLEVFLRTKKGVCIAVDPRLRVPRHMRLFEKMMVSLLFRMKVRSSTGYLSLLRVVRNPIGDHIPANTVFYRVERDGEEVEVFDFCASLARGGARNPHEGDDAKKPTAAASSDEAGSAPFAQAHREAVAARRFRPFAFIIGGMSKGDVDVDYAPKAQVRSVRLGDRGMSAAAVVSELLHGLEEEWLREDNEAG
ncbi:unnamed protein product [Phytomonas sp. EM1]|nr:unnamed protein product [Phytomonas sp. EM1]|eukprot:CCW64647.1 unnamed protein product [Phytomonas sp. isolate EM1]